MGKDSLVPHIHRVNFRVSQWKCSHIPIHVPDIPPPVDHGWVRSGEFIQPVWSEKQVLQSCLVDILAEKHSLDEEDNSGDEISEDEEDSVYSSAEDSD